MLLIRCGRSLLAIGLLLPLLVGLIPWSGTLDDLVGNVINGGTVGIFMCLFKSIVDGKAFIRAMCGGVMKVALSTFA